MRDTTERPEAVAAGTVRLIGTSQEAIEREVSVLMTDPHQYEKMSSAVNPYGDGMIPAGYYDGTNRGLLICDTTIIGIDYDYYYYYYYYSSSYYYCYYYSPVHAWGPYQLTACGGREYHGLGLRVRTPYLATINNLSSSVTKTAAQTMKITYTITES